MGFYIIAMNVKEITSEHMDFVITRNTGIEMMYPGMLIKTGP
jgi:hypothetical protein